MSETANLKMINAVLQICVHVAKNGVDTYITFSFPTIVEANILKTLTTCKWNVEYRQTLGPSKNIV